MLIKNHTHIINNIIKNNSIYSAKRLNKLNEILSLLPMKISELSTETELSISSIRKYFFIANELGILVMNDNRNGAYKIIKTGGLTS